MFLFQIAIVFCYATSSEKTIELPRTSLGIGKEHLDVQLATDTPSRERGLMKRNKLGNNEGMLFVFPHSQQVSFWMKDTQLPLSIAYISGSGRILEIHDLEPLNEHGVLSCSSTVVYALEVAKNWFAEHGILAGDSVNGLPSSSSAQ
ncbi:MAG: hypothetical protein A3F67_01650 [Verrucomicrobia bacterium RIFCSPHIGHO2_12_FULL_41_10]|nr:MAG: hypothetical protein A3F67_01650 [Verrucomicrobia bacterium RIFCSPHIGHO2_12_FULL_41_10]